MVRWYWKSYQGTIDAEIPLSVENELVCIRDTLSNHPR